MVYNTLGSTQFVILPRFLSNATDFHSILDIVFAISGPVVQTLTKLLANVTLKFLSRNMANTLICLLKNVSNVCSEHINVFENTLAASVNTFVINKLLKLTV